MKTEFKRDPQHTWLILSGGDLAPEEGYRLKMLSGNRIPGLLSCRLSRIDQRTRLYYDISGRHTLRDVMETEDIRYPLLTRLFGALAGICGTLEEYLLPPEDLLLLPERIYFDPGDGGIRFIVYPGRNTSVQEQLQQLSGALLPHLDQQDKTAVVMGYSLYQRCMSEELPLDILRDLLSRNGRKEEAPVPVTREELERAVLLDSFFDEEEEDGSFLGSMGGKVRKWLFRKQAAKQDPASGPPAPHAAMPSAPPAAAYLRPEDGAGPADTSGNTMLLDLSAAAGKTDQKAVLRIPDVEGNSRDVVLEKESCVIGKTGAGADIELPSGAVSRRHARLQRAGGAWLIRDLNSRNGTYCNGEVLLPEQDVLLSDGDRLLFADVSCVFRKNG